MKRWLQRGASLVALTVLLVLGACATLDNNPKDPLEPVNRAVFGFNDTIDQAAIKPVAKAYVVVVPELVRTGVSNFFSNLGDVWSGVNNLLQAKPGAAANSILRFAFNSTFGMFGLFDIATQAGIERQKEDFGQTLGRWGVPSGPYLVLPILGPSSMRDAPSAILFDLPNDPINRITDMPVRYSVAGARIVDVRASVLNAEKVIDGASLDKYAFIRNAWIQRRQNQVYDGNPPIEKEDDE